MYEIQYVNECFEVPINAVREISESAPVLLRRGRRDVGQDKRRTRYLRSRCRLITCTLGQCHFLVHVSIYFLTDICLYSYYQVFFKFHLPSKVKESCEMF